MPAPPRVTSAGVLLGGGLGALFDGILLHQVLQWHNLLSSVTPPTDLVTSKYNMLWDGAFHLVAWLVTALGIAQLWRATRRTSHGVRSSTFIGALLVGWGAFNLVEGLVDHHLLELHHVRPGPGEIWWDLGFLVWGGVMLTVGGRLLTRQRRRPSSESYGRRP